MVTREHAATSMLQSERKAHTAAMLQIQTKIKLLQEETQLVLLDKQQAATTLDTRSSTSAPTVHDTECKMSPPTDIIYDTRTRAGVNSAPTRLQQPSYQHLSQQQQWAGSAPLVLRDNAPSLPPSTLSFHEAATPLQKSGHLQDTSWQCPLTSLGNISYMFPHINGYSACLKVTMGTCRPCHLSSLCSPRLHPPLCMHHFSCRPPLTLLYPSDPYYPRSSLLRVSSQI
jgi:hypothetical protein